MLHHHRIGFAGLLVLSSTLFFTLSPAPANDAGSRLAIDEAILADSLFTDDWIGERVPPDFDPNWVPEEPEQIVLAPGSDFGFIGHTNTGWNPPDTDLAVGPEGIVVAVNGGIRYKTKTGTLRWSRPITGGSGFWAGQGAQTFVFDPVELFDPHTNRFVVATVEHVGATDYLLIAVSRDDDPETFNDWHKYRFNVNSQCGFIDFPNLGIDDEAIYITTDCFQSPGGNKIWIIDKSRVMNGLSTSPTRVNASGGFLSLGNTKNYDADAPAQYFASASVASTFIQLKAIMDPLGAPVQRTFNLPVSTFFNPPRAQQRGSTNRVATVDRRIKNGVYRNGSAWFSHTIAQSGLARTRWYEIDMRGWPVSGLTPILLQQGNLNLGSGIHNWFADIDVDEFGNAAIAFNRSSVNDFVGVARSFRTVDDPTNTFRPETIQQVSTSPELGNRWGDYGGMHIDPSSKDGNFSQFWNCLEYRTTSWRTWVATFQIETGLPCPEDLSGNGVVDFEDILEVLAHWGEDGSMGGDTDGDNDVDFEDLLNILSAWGACP